MAEEREAEQPRDWEIEPDVSSDETGAFDYPLIDYGVAPQRVCHFHRQFRTTAAAASANNFFKGVKWSPDGSCFLSNSEDNTLRVFTCPGYGCEESLARDLCNGDEAADSYLAGLEVAEGESVYDFCWYPGMSASDPVSCVFASTTRDHPIHIWDAWTGQLRCTYRAYDAMDEITPAFSIAFNPTGSKIFAGYNKSIRIFDVHRPGREFEQYATLKGKNEGQAGLISAIAFSPAHTGLLATGSYSQTTAIYAEDNMELLYVLHGQQGGVTHIMFSKDGNYLYTGGRKDPYIMCWDVRKAVDVVYKLYRSSEDTNQRIYFDIEPRGQHLATGGQDGLVHVYDVQTGRWVTGFQAASDTVNGFSFHPFLPMAVSSSGQRRFDVPDNNDEVEMHLQDGENCLSVWNFSSYHPRADDVPSSDGPNSNYSNHLFQKNKT